MMDKIVEDNNPNKILIYGTLYAITFFLIFASVWLVPHPSYSFPIIRDIIVFFASVLLIKYFFYMLISPWHDAVVSYKRLTETHVETRYHPKVTIMVPAWNEEKGILDTIQTLLKSSYTNTEIIIINDGSTDNSDLLIRQFITDYDKRKRYYRRQGNTDEQIDVRYHYKQNAGKGAALNAAIEMSTGDILISIDADCIATKDTIEKFVECFRDPAVMAAVGNVKIGSTKRIIGVIQYLEFLFAFYFKKGDSLLNSIYIIGGAAGAFRKEVFTKLGGYNTKNITEDIDLSMRIQEAGMKIVYAAEAIVYTEGASTISDLIKQRLRWTRGRIETFSEKKHLFFSTKPQHNKFLSWFILPLAYFGELQLSLELFFLAFLYVYSFLINDFSSFISGIVIVSSMFLVQMLFDDKKTRHFSFYILSPIGWLLFYLTTFVEFSALVKSMQGLAKGENIRWQRWKRQGVSG